jgi:hypothetical protein
MPCGQGLLARSRAQANLPVFAPKRLEQTGGGPEPRVERLVDAVFLENAHRDERQLVNGRSEFRGHASRSNGHEANSGRGGRNLPRANGQTGFLRCRWLISAGRVHYLWRLVRRALGYESRGREFESLRARHCNQSFSSF